MFKRRSFLQALIAFFAGAAARGWGQRTHDPSRIALVIGNNSYRKAALANAANDARAIQMVLADAGFAIDSRIDAGAESMAAAVRDFGAAIARPEVKLAIFYYAGHGVQVEWRNYLLPVDANVKTRADLRKQTFDLGVLLDVLPKSQDKTFVVILDACRDNPFGDSIFPERKGLSQFDAPVSTLIAFSTSPGSVASDGTGANGLYTENLARELRVGGLRIEDVFKRVRANVSLASRGRQIPWESTSLVSDVYVFPPVAPPTEDELERQFEEEAEQWNRVKGSKNPADWAALLSAFPNGKLSEIAQARLNLLLAAAGPVRPRGLERRGIVLAPGLPVPEFLRRPENPFAAGTYAIDRRFSVGDEAAYVGYEEDSYVSRRFTRRVTKVDVEADRVELNQARFVTDLLGNLVKKDGIQYAIPVQLVPAQLQVGKSWDARFATMRRLGAFDEDMSAQVVARETVKVPAGVFDAFRIEARIYGVQTSGGKRGRRAGNPRRVDIVRWEVPGLNFAIKEERTLRRRAGTEEVKSFELESLRQKE